MKKNILQIIILLICVNAFTQTTQKKEQFLEDENGKEIKNEAERKFFLTKNAEKKATESKQLSFSRASQTAVEMCTNSGFEQHETISGGLKLKNFLYTIGDPPGPTQCRSITNTADSYVDIYNPNATSVMATTVPANFIDPYLGNINAFDQFALKINYENSSTYGSIVQGKRFKTNNENFLKFNFKSVLMTVYDTGHADNQPFIKARIINSSGVVVSQFCLVGDETNCIFTKIPGSSAAILYTNNWQSGLLDISSIPNNEEFTVEFMASRCGFGAHFGYMYVDDICTLHTNENIQGSIELNPLNKVCSTLPINVCGTYTIPNSGGISASLATITLNVYNNLGVSVYSTSVPTSINTTTHQFCFSLNANNFPNSINANYDVGVVAAYTIVPGSSPCLGTVFNTATDADANTGWDISFQNCSTSCNFEVNTTKLSRCDINHDGSENFTLSDANSLLVTSTTGLTFSYFERFIDATNNVNAITNSNSFLSTSKTIYVRVAQSASCFRVIPITLEVKNPPVRISGVLNVCSGNTTLTASLGASYLWNTGALTQSISPTTIGTYSVSVTDASGCVNSTSVVIEPTQIATTPNVIVTQPSCSNALGTIQVTTLAAEYSFNNGATWTTNSTINNLAPGSYFVKIKTNNNCISYPLEVNISAAQTSYPSFNYTLPAFCGAFGSITITTVAPFYSFDDGATWTTNPIATNLLSDTYKIRTKDAQGCISNFNTVVLTSVSLETPTITIINPACGTNGSITINAVSNFYTFDGGTTWGTSNVLTNMVAGSYSVAIKSNIGCTSEYSTAYVTDLQNTMPEINVVQPICGTGGSIVITTVGDFYSFDNGVSWTSSNVAVNIPPGTYFIIVKNSAGCTSQVNYVVLYSPVLEDPILDVVQPQCGINGSITVNSLSDYYSFDGGTTWVTTNFVSVPAGNYFVKIKNNLGCVSYSTYIGLYIPLLPEPSYTVVQPTCGNTGSITINTPAASYSINDGTTWVSTPVFNNLSSGSYVIKIKNNMGCESYISYANLYMNYLPTPTYTVINPSCGNAGTITITTAADLYSINGGQSWFTSPIFNNLSWGYFYPMIKNSAGCQSNSNYVYLSQTLLSLPTVTVVNACPANSGSITITSLASSYSINGGTTWTSNPLFSNLPSSYYSVKTRTSNGCESETLSIFISNNLPSANFIATAPTCGVGGSITITTPAASYSIDGGATWSTNAVFTNLLPTYYYNIKVKNSLGCVSADLSHYFSTPLLPNPNYSVTPLSCGVAGTITITTAAAQYSINGGNTWQTSAVFTNLNSGYYSIVIKNSSGCISNTISTQIAPYYIANPNITIVQPTCGASGSITVATSAAQYSFDGGLTWSTSAIKSNLSSGYYTVVIKNNLGCTSNPYTASVNIRPYYLPAPLFTTVQPSCGLVGNITIVTTADFYSFDNGTTWTTNPVLLNPSQGSYNLKIKNNLGCQSVAQYTYINLYYIQQPSVSVIQPTCGSPFGTVTVTTPASQYSFNNGTTWSSNATATNLPSGSIYVKIKNSLGCESNYRYAYINYPPTITAAPVATVTQPSSCGTTDGSISILTNAAEYSFNDGVTWTTNSVKGNVAAGTYYIKTRSSTTSCPSNAAIVTLSSGVTIAAPTFTVANPGCNNQYGSITISTPASYYSFDNGITFVSSNIKNNLPIGIYNIKIKNASDCISAANVATITASANLPAPNYTSLQPSCLNATGSITITSIAALYSFDNGLSYSSSNNRTGLNAGTYLIKIKDATGCLSTASSVLLNAQPLTPAQPALSITQPLSCLSTTGSIVVTSSAAFFSFDNGATWSTSNTAPSLAAGTYDVMVKDSSSGCASLATTAIINAPPNAPAAPTVVVNQPVSCANPLGTISINSTAFAYSFDNGTTYSTNSNSIPLPAGTYSIKVKNSYNCESISVPAVINAPTDYPLPPTFTITQPDCTTASGSITILTSATAYSFDDGATWTPSATRLNTVPSTYALKVKNALGCVSSSTTAVVIPFTNFTILPNATPAQTFCIDQNATLNNITITGQNIKWYNAQTSGIVLANSTNLSSGTTYFASQTINGCESLRTSVLVTIQNTPPPTAAAAQTFCATQNATLANVTVAGTGIKWYDSVSNSTALPTTTLLTNGTTYFASQTVNNCESTARTPISTTLITSLSATNYAETLCDDLNDGNEIITLKNYNSYLLSNTTNCTFDFYQTPNGAVNQTASDVIDSAINYTLNSGTTTFYVRITSNNGCFQIVTLDLKVIAKPIITINDSMPICEGNNININAGAGFDSYTWSNGIVGQQTINISQAGNYAVTVTKNSQGIVCSTTKNFVVVNSNTATISEIVTTDWDFFSILVQLSNNSTGNYQYSIDGVNYQTSNYFEDLQDGDYTVYVKDINGCGITKQDINLLTYPKFFTPNNDNYNDTWNIKSSQNEKNIKIKIFDRYGKLLTVFTSESAGWDGNYNGNPIPSDDYWFEVVRENGKIYKGHFALKR